MKLLVYNSYCAGVFGVCFELYPACKELLDYLPDYFPRIISNSRVYEGFIPLTSIPDSCFDEKASTVFYSICNAEVEMVQSSSSAH